MIMMMCTCIHYEPGYKQKKKKKRRCLLSPKYNILVFWWKKCFSFLFSRYPREQFEGVEWVGSLPDLSLRFQFTKTGNIFCRVLLRFNNNKVDYA